MNRSLERALHGSALDTPVGRAGFVALVGALLASALLGQALLVMDRPLAALLGALPVYLLGLAWCLPTFGLLAWLDRRERESPWLLGGALLFGAAVSPALAALMGAFRVDVYGSLITLNGQVLPDVPFAPLAQEGAKALGLLVLYWFLRPEFDNALDGLVYGALVGLGFGLTDTVLVAVQQGGSLPDLVVRGLPLFGFSQHTLWTGLAGAGLGLARQSQKRWVRWWGPPALFAAAVVAHASYDAFGFPVVGALGTGGGLLVTALGVSLGVVLVQPLAYALLAWLVVLGVNWEIQVIRAALADEVGTPAVTPDEYEAILHETPFRSRVVPGVAPALGRQIVNAQDELAFRKWHLRLEGGDPEDDPAVQAWREDLARLRQGAEPA